MMTQSEIDRAFGTEAPACTCGYNPTPTQHRFFCPWRQWYLQSREAPTIEHRVRFVDDERGFGPWEPLPEHWSITAHVRRYSVREMPLYDSFDRHTSIVEFREVKQ